MAKRTQDIWMCREETSPLARESSIRPSEDPVEMSPKKYLQGGLSKINMLTIMSPNDVSSASALNPHVPNANDGGSRTGKSGKDYQCYVPSCPQNMSPPFFVLGDWGHVDFKKNQKVWEPTSDIRPHMSPVQLARVPRRGNHKTHVNSTSPWVFGKNELNPRKIGVNSCAQPLSYRSMCLGTHTPPVPPGEVSPTLLPAYRTQK